MQQHGVSQHLIRVLQCKYYGPPGETRPTLACAQAERWSLIGSKVRRHQPRRADNVCNARRRRVMRRLRLLRSISLSHPPKKGESASELLGFHQGGLSTAWNSIDDC